VAKGRPKGTYQKRRFIDTNLGRYIYLHEPLLFDVLCPTRKLNYQPDIQLIKTVISCSNNPSFQNKRYTKYLKEYEKHGLHVPRVRSITPSQKQHYHQLRFTRALQYIRENQSHILKADMEVYNLLQARINSIENK
jgi:hypothetical protein